MATAIASQKYRYNPVEGSGYHKTICLILAENCSMKARTKKYLYYHDPLTFGPDESDAAKSA
jgi:hypothetical protein